MTRYLLIGLGLFVGTLALAYGLFVQNGIDPLAPEMWLYALLGVVVALYVAMRLTLLLRWYLKRTGRDGDTDEEATGSKPRSAWSRWGRSAALDARLDARRERLRRAQEKQQSGEER